MFALNGTSGQVTVARALDSESTDPTTVVLTVAATDGGAPALFGTTNVTITVTGQFLHLFYFFVHIGFVKNIFVL